MRMWPLLTVLAAWSVFWAATVSGQSLQYSSGQDVVPVFEGWEANADGTSSLVFGYLNRNYEEEVDIPVGPDNHIDLAPSGDAGQPTHFYPRRNRFIFRVKVPKDFGQKEVVWTLTAHGKTEKAYGHLLPEEIINDQVISENRRGAGYAPGNKAPWIEIVGAADLRTPVNDALSLMVRAGDDGIPKRGPAANSRPPGRFSGLGLRVNWIEYRGPENAKVTFDPWIRPGADKVPGWTPPEAPPDGKFTTKVKFSAPGTYVLRAIADDGYLYTPVHVSVTVTEPE
ncbi:MAG TPA: hypothetical protein VEV17_24820 [Bryobacteraceae bacterium]|nr:hypothetical protein [Bryobacteraceae bacterium]